MIKLSWYTLGVLLIIAAIAIYHHSHTRTYYCEQGFEKIVSCVPPDLQYKMVQNKEFLIMSCLQNKDNDEIAERGFRNFQKMSCSDILRSIGR